MVKQKYKYQTDPKNDRFLYIKRNKLYIFKIVNNKGIKRFKKFNGLKTLQEYY